ncbi:MAG: hypothetical protein AAF581_09825 [Planctomycetota bacterium]
MHRTLLTLLLAFAVTSLACAQQVIVETNPQRGVSKAGPIKTANGLPAYQYGSSRASKKWVTTPYGTRVGVGAGIEWEEKTYYLSLTWDLVATPTGSDQATWSQHCSAFWNRIGIEDYTRDDETVRCLALRTASKPDFVEYRDLQTGKRIGGTTAQVPGKKIELANSWNGARGSADDKHHVLVRSATQWQKIHTTLFDGIADAPPAKLDIDFSTHSIFVLYSGKTSNCKGFSATPYQVDAKTVLLRTHAHTYQSMGSTPDTWPYGVFVVPTRVGGTLVVERNAQGLIGGPAIWKEMHRLTVE